jgi:colanic acid/amylovoran biosynthesis glycosyltransferase
LVEIKGHEYLIRAIHKMRAEHPAIILELVGDGPLRSSLEQLVGKLGLQSSVIFCGALPEPEVKRVLDNAHLFVLPSVTVNGAQEGQGLALQEAQACGLPVVATQHGALPEGLLPGTSGFLVPERDPDALCERLSFLVTHPETWPDMGAAGRTFVERNYDIRELNSDLVKLYYAQQPA